MPESASAPRPHYHALLAGVLGFVALSGALAWIAKVLRLVFVVMLVLSQVFGRRQGAPI